MIRNLILTAVLVISALVLSACGPRNVDQVQPIKFQYVYAWAVTGSERRAAIVFHMPERCPAATPGLVCS